MGRRICGDLDRSTRGSRTSSNLININTGKDMSTRAPVKEKVIKTRPKVPWYDEKIAKAKRERHKAERVWRRSGLKYDFAIFKKKKNHATHIINKARKAFYSDVIDSNSEDQGKLFRSMKKLLAPSQCLLFPDYDDHQSLANDIGEFFCRKIH